MNLSNIDAANEDLRIALMRRADAYREWTEACDEVRRAQQTVETVQRENAPPVDRTQQGKSA